MESEPQLETPSLLSKEPSGIQAVSSQDDDDNVSDSNPLIENDNSPEKTIENVDGSKNSTSKSSNRSGNGSIDSGSNGSFASGEEEFETPVAGPDEEALEKAVVVGENGIPADGSSSGLTAHSGSLPIEKALADENDPKNEGVHWKEDAGEVGDEIGDSAYGVGSAPGDRVLGEEDVAGVNVDEEATVDGCVAFGVEENASLPSGVVEGGSLEFTNERDAIVDSIDVDVVEAVRSGVAVVGVGEREESTSTKTVEAEEEKPIDEGCLIEESANVDVVEPGAAAAVEVEERKDPEVESRNEETSVIEEPDIVEDSVDAKSAPVDSKATETDLVKSTGEEDSVVDEIHVDAVEAVRSGVAVVGNSGDEGMGTEVKEVGASVGENVTLGNEFEPLVGANEEPVTDSNAESTEHEGHVEGQVEQVEMLQEPQRGEDIKPETDIKSKELQPAGGVEGVSCGDEGKVQPDYKLQSTTNGVGGETINDRSYARALLDGLDAADSDKTQLHEKVEQTETLNPKIGVEAEDDKNHVSQEECNIGNTDGESKSVLSLSPADAGQHVEELERSFVAAEGVESQIATDSEEEADSDEEGEEKEMFDSAALAALLKAATSAGSDSGTITITSQDGSRLFSVERPAGLGPSLRSVRPASRPSNSSLVTPSSLAAPSEENLSEEEKKKLQHMNQLRVKFLRLVQRLGYTEEDSIAAQVLYRLALLAGRSTSPAFSLENAKQTAMQLEAEGKDDLNFSLTILVLGKTGVGKSATINSIFGEEKVKINAFEPETTSVHEVSGIIDGIKIRVIDAPGLKSSGMEQGFNRKVLASVKKFTKKYPPDVMLYVDRLDSQTRDLNDLPVLRTITSSLGSSIWRSAIVTLTHAACAPPDGPSGSPLSYEVFVTNRSHIVQQFIGQAVGDLRLMNPSLMNPVSLVENHPACRKNREGQKVLPNGQAWRPQLLLFCYSLKILSEANSSLKPQDPFDHRKLFGFRVRSAPLPYLLSTMLQPRAHPKLSTDQGGDNGDSDIDLDDLSDSDQEEEEDEYDQLPPFKPLRKSQIAKLSRDQRRAYFEEYDYRVKLLQRKQWREELKRMREMKKKGKSGMDGYSENPEDFDAENEAPAAVPVPLPDMVLPPSFDSDNPAYRYRFLEPTSQFLARPVLDTHGWDHDCGYDGVNLEQNLGIAGRFPASVTVQVTKDKKESNIHLDSAVSAKHGENGSSLLGFDIQTIGKQPAYIIRGETKSKLLKKNKTGAGVCVTFLGENVATGVKLEDQLNLGKRLVLLGSTGTVRSQKDAVYGANLEVRLREADYPIGQDQSSLNLSLMKWRGDLAVGGNLQSQFSVGRNSKMAVRVSLNNKLSGQISVRTSSSDHLQLALAGLIPIALSIYRNFKPSVSENCSLY